MYRNILITTACMSFTLFAAPSMSSADNQPIQSGLEEQAVEVARDGEAKKVETRTLASKRVQSEETAESVDCFYDANKANPDCGSAKPD